jgi:hypothetical protein
MPPRTLRRAPLALVLLALCQSPVSARARDPAPAAGDSAAVGRPDDETTESRWYVMLGLDWLSFAPLDQRLAAAGYGKVGHFALSPGLGGYGSRGRWLFGIEGHGVLPASGAVAGPPYEADLVGGFGLVRMGVLAVAAGGLHLYPSIGMGGGGFDLTVARDAEAGFDEVVGAPQRETSMTAGFLLFDTALGADYRFTMERFGNGTEHGLVLGARVGCAVSPWSSPWSGERLAVGNGPSIGVSGPYAMVLVGWGGRHREQD